MSWVSRLGRRSAFDAFQPMRITFLADLAEALRGGAELSRAIAAAARRCEDPRQARVYRDLRERLSQGKRLPAVMGAWFSPSERMLLEAFLEGARTNEEIGKAFDALVKVIEPREQVLGEQRKLQVVVVLVIAAVAAALATASVGIVEAQNVIPKERWPAWLPVAIALAQALLHFWWLWLAGCIALPFVAAQVLRRWSGALRRRWDRRVPGFRSYRAINGSMLMIALGALSGAGRGIGESCLLIAEHATPWLRSYLMAIRARAQQQAEADIVDVGLFDWRLMARVECLCAGAPVGVAIRKVGLDSSTSLARETVARLQRVQKLALALIPAVFVVCILAVLTMGAAMVMSMRDLR